MLHLMCFGSITQCSLVDHLLNRRPLYMTSDLIQWWENVRFIILQLMVKNKNCNVSKIKICCVITYSIEIFSLDKLSSKKTQNSEFSLLIQWTINSQGFEQIFKRNQILLAKEWRESKAKLKVEHVSEREWFIAIATNKSSGSTDNYIISTCGFPEVHLHSL